MPDLLVAAWTCEMCHRSGIVSGRRTATDARGPDPIPVNCYFCQATVMVQLPEGLSAEGLRVEGEHALPSGTRCAECGAEVKGYWDERDTPLAVCARFSHRNRLPEPPPDPDAWEVLLQTQDETIERKRADGGWAFRSRSAAPTEWRRIPYKKVSLWEGFVPDPGRPLSDVFREIRAEHHRMREEERRRRAPRAQE